MDRNTNAAQQLALWFRRTIPNAYRESVDKGLLPVVAQPTRTVTPTPRSPVQPPPRVANTRGTRMGNYLPLDNRGNTIAPFEKFKTVRGQMSGLGNPLEFQMTNDSYGYTTQPEPSVVSTWGQNLLSIGQAYLQTTQQHDLMKLNIARAEQGLPPIESSAIAPQVNVGVSSDVQRMVFIGLGVVAVIALASVVTKGK